MDFAKHWSATLDDYVIDLAWSPRGDFLAAASAAGPIIVFEARGGTPLHELAGHDGGANRLTWFPGAAPLLASGGQDGYVRFWDAASGQPAGAAMLGSAWVEQLAWTGESLAAAAGRKLVLLESDGSTLLDSPEAPKTISSLAFRPAAGERRPATLAASYFGGIRLISPEDFKLSKVIPYPNAVVALIWSPDGKWLVSGNQDASVHLWVPEEDVEFHMSGYEGKVKHLSFDCTSRWLATAGGDKACIWDCSGPGPEGREPEMYPHGGPVCALAFQRAHGLLATAAQDSTLRLWSPERRQPLRANAQIASPAVKLDWSPDDRLLAIGTEQGQIQILKCQD